MNLWALLAVLVGLLLLINVAAFHLFNASWSLYEFSSVGTVTAGGLMVLFGGMILMYG